MKAPKKKNVLVFFYTPKRKTPFQPNVMVQQLMSLNREHLFSISKQSAGEIQMLFHGKHWSIQIKVLFTMTLAKLSSTLALRHFNMQPVLN